AGDIVQSTGSSRRRNTSWPRDWSSDVCSSDLASFVKRASVTNQIGSAIILKSEVAGQIDGERPVGLVAQGPAVEVDGTVGQSGEIGRASCRERVGIGVIAGSLRAAGRYNCSAR